MSNLITPLLKSLHWRCTSLKVIPNFLLSTMPNLIWSLYGFLFDYAPPCLLLLSDIHGSCCFLTMPSMLLPQSLTLTGMLFSGTCMTYSSMSFKHLFTLTSNRFSLLILSKTVAVYCNSPSPHRGLFFFIAYINTPTLHNITHSVYIQSSSV